MSAIKYLLDENVDPSLRHALHQHWPNMVVWAVGDPGAPLRSTPDPDILVWCEAHAVSLVTNNRASMPVHLQDHLTAERHVPGIFILNPGMSFGETVDELALIWMAAEPEIYADLVNFLPIR
ncbi:MAG: DUF5615 family PIN-like protein [Anaerolineales bacterium]|nr:DUF5615 family PIN-like protein [Anaerolineales bacterium]